MRKRQSSKRKVRNANSPKKEKPLDILLYGPSYGYKIFRKEKLKNIFLTKKFRPDLALILQKQIWILKESESGYTLTISKRKKQEFIKQKSDEILLLKKTDSELSRQLIKEKEAFITGLKYNY